MKYLNNFTLTESSYILAQLFLVVTGIQPKCWNLLTLLVTIFISQAINFTNLGAFIHLFPSIRLKVSTCHVSATLPTPTGCLFHNFSFLELLIYEYSVTKFKLTFPKIRRHFVLNNFDIVLLAKLERRMCRIEKLFWESWRNSVLCEVRWLSDFIPMEVKKLAKYRTENKDIETRNCMLSLKKCQLLLLNIHRELHRNVNSKTTQNFSGRLFRQKYIFFVVLNIACY